MYTILVSKSNELITSVRERIVQRSKLVDDLQFLVEPTYNGYDMSTFSALCEYITPVSREYKTEMLVKSDELYKGNIQYKVCVDTNLTKEPGNVEIQLTFIKVEMNADGQVVQRVRKTTPTTITVVPVSAWSNAMPDSSLTAIDQRLVMAEMLIGAANDTLATMEMTKADNLLYDESSNVLQLTANGQLVGSAVQLHTKGTGVASIEIDGDGNMVIHYSDGRSENLGMINSDACSGVYIPNYSTDGILTFTLKDDAEEQSYSFDINSSNDWNEISSEEQSSDYVWNAL